MFFYSLPIFFNEIHLLSPQECFLIVLAGFALLYISTPVGEVKWQQKPYTNFLLSSWLGNMSLYWVFWPFFLCLNAGLLSADLLAKSGKITVSTWDEIHFAFFLGMIWWAVSLWRCSSNTSARLWGAMARFTVLAAFAEYALMLYIRIDYPRIFFNCEEALLDYGSCF